MAAASESDLSLRKAVRTVDKASAEPVRPRLDHPGINDYHV